MLNCVIGVSRLGRQSIASGIPGEELVAVTMHGAASLVVAGSVSNAHSAANCSIYYVVYKLYELELICRELV